MTATILITRPDPAGSEFATVLRERLDGGCAVLTSPIMQIEAHDNLPDLSGIGTLIFTSRHGVESFARLTQRRDIPAYAVGPGTGDAARAIGLQVIIADGDAQRLTTRLLADKPAQPCLHIRGEHVATRLSTILSSAGLETFEAILYAQQAKPLSAKALTLIAHEGHVILPLFSPRSAQLVFEQIRQAKCRARFTIVAISQAVANHVPSGFAHNMLVAKEPDASAMLETLEKLCRSQPT